MPDSEFSIIEQYFATLSAPNDRVVLGIGDDAAVINPPPGAEFLSRSSAASGSVLADDPASTAAALLNHCCAELREAGARPLSFTLALTLPAPDHAWLRDFSGALADAAMALGVTLVGGDTTKGPLTVAILCHGFR